MTPLSDIDELTGGQKIPAAAWRVAGIAPDPAVTTLAQASIDQLRAFNRMNPTTARGYWFRTAATSMLVARLGEQEAAQ